MAEEKSAANLTVTEIMKVHEAFRPLLVSQLLKRTLDEITEHKKDRDEAQVARLNTALECLNVKGVDLCAYPDTTHKSLVAQMKKQLDKIQKKKDKKDKKGDK
eukprot:CAMPEP_0197022278 /NCGR_PEP_ID=MMETSP1384-20130603/3182_1 /TAXON_ID=29189 /ORGANISM="Ammonia sp." /LENGTH=102 /DNA_ID=CAMNT_0042450289 /DNA_START=96 /DNA_END=404 /DNA_ORIENTATION=+